jgi:hypothetical protein
VTSERASQATPGTSAPIGSAPAPSESRSAQPPAVAPDASTDEDAEQGRAGVAARALWGGKAAAGRSKKGRAAMPSWDEIVFGARTDDDLA